MRMAKATAQDIECALTIMGQLDDLEQGTMPRTGHDEHHPVYPASDETDYPSGFHESNESHCKAALSRILDVFTKHEHGGALMRVIFGMDCMLKNDVLDPAVNHLSWHPDLLPAIHERQRREAVAKVTPGNAKVIDWKRRDGLVFVHDFTGYAARLYHSTPENGWVLAYKEGGGDITHPMKAPEPGMEPVRVKLGDRFAWCWVQFGKEPS